MSTTFKSYLDAYLTIATLKAKEHRVPKDNRRILKLERFIDNNICCYCGIQMNYYVVDDGKSMPEDIVTLDHIVPKAKGGKNNKENLVNCCLYCNKKKSHHPREHFVNHIIKKRENIPL